MFKVPLYNKNVNAEILMNITSGRIAMVYTNACTIQ